MLFRKEKKIIAKIEAYLTAIDQCRDLFSACVTRFILTTAFDPLTDLVDSVHTMESAADDLRRDIEYQLFHKALIPESREDILNLLEAFDDIPNAFQNICYIFSCEKITIPPSLKEVLLQFVEMNLAAYGEARAALPLFLYRKALYVHLEKVDHMESEVDKQERVLISRIFDLSIETADKLLLKGLVDKIASISDRAQELADRLTIAVVKRKL